MGRNNNNYNNGNNNYRGKNSNRGNNNNRNRNNRGGFIPNNFENFNFNPNNNGQYYNNQNNDNYNQNAGNYNQNNGNYNPNNIDNFQTPYNNQTPAYNPNKRRRQNVSPIIIQASQVQTSTPVTTEKIRCDLILGDYSDYLKSKADLKLFKDMVPRQPKQVFVIKGEDGTFIENKIDTEKFIVRTVLLFSHKKHYVDILNDNREGQGEMATDLTTDQLITGINATMASIRNLFNPMTSYAVMPTGDQTFGAALAYCCKANNWVQVETDPINHVPFKDIEPKLAAEVFCTRCRHYYKFHYVNTTQEPAEVSPQGVFDLNQL